MAAASELKFEIPGPFVSGNHAKFRNGARTTRSRDFDRKVSMLCLAAKIEQKWVIPMYVEVGIGMFNIDLDVDNCVKEILDPCERIAFVTDRRVASLFVARYKDNRGERALVVIRPADRKEFGLPRAFMPKG